MKDQNKRLEGNNLLQAFIKDVMKIRILTKEEEDTLAGQMKEGDVEAMRQLVEANLRFVLMVVFRHYKPGDPVMDMISGGCFGLIRSAKAFEPGMGVRFLTYAAYGIRQGVVNALVDSYQDNHESLDAPITGSAEDDEGFTLGDSIAAEEISPEEEAETCDMGRYLLSLLNKRERFVIEQHYWEERTLEAIGASLGIMGERVRQIEARALFKLRYALKEGNTPWQIKTVAS
jgi:RNA polymerase sigma factor (sigma-70 family)